MKWDDEKDNQLIKEIFVIRPQEYASASVQPGSIGEEITNVSNLLDGFFVNQISVGNGYNNLVCKYKQKRNTEKNASGINNEYTEMDDFLVELDPK